MSLAVDTVLRKKLLDQEAKIREDPFFMIKKAEMQGLKEIFCNPLKMRMLQQVGAVDVNLVQAFLWSLR